MKKTLILITVLAIAVTALISCSKNANSPVASPTPVATMPPLLVDDFEDGNTINALGGGWYFYGDTAYGGANAGLTTPQFYAGCTVSPVNSLQVRGNAWSISTDIPYVPESGYYGFVGACTTFTAVTDLSVYKGIRFYARTDYQPTSANDRMNVYVVSQYEITHNVQSHYRAQLTAALGNTWYFYEVPWSSFTQDYVYDSNYPNHPRTRTQVLQNAVMIGFDKEYVYTSTGTPPSSWSQAMYIDNIELY